MSVTRWRLPQAPGDPLRVGLAIALARRGRFLAFLAVQSQRKAFGDQAFAEMLDPCTRQLKASAILTSGHPAPSASALSRLCARRNFCDDPLRCLMIPSQTIRSSSDSRTTDLVDGNLLVTSSFPTIPKTSNPTS